MRRSATLPVLALVLGGCNANPVTAPELPLADRFEIVAFGSDDPFFEDQLWRWEWPIRSLIIGSRDHADAVSDQLQQLGQLANVPVEIDSFSPNMTIEFSRRNRESYCEVAIYGVPNSFRAEIYIATDQPQRHIRRCIAQELGQAMGLLTDTDGRRDTAFSSRIGTDYLTDADLALFAILYDRRLRTGMHRKEAMPIVRRIVAEMEAADGLSGQ